MGWARERRRRLRARVHHRTQGGDRCDQDAGGRCRLCRVDLTLTCQLCSGRGYHRLTCPRASGARVDYPEIQGPLRRRDRVLLVIVWAVVAVGAAAVATLTYDGPQRPLRPSAADGGLDPRPAEPEVPPAGPGELPYELREDNDDDDD